MEKEVEELEKLGKPILYVKSCEILEKTHDNFYVLYWNSGKVNFQKYYTSLAEEKENILITDDFIFIKTSKN